ncbi:MAG: glycoside hydrolase family 15 protein [Actinobacteria bacterium]|nr:glycoside hydrolase family 15 protein [Actinomycetota bacterium]
MTKTLDLRQKSIEVIESNQSPSGGLVACPTFRTYNYCWLRDGTFIAYAMDRVDRHHVAERFYKWVKEVISSQAGRVERLISRATAGEPIGPDEHLHTRYNLDGSEGQDGWPNFQMDGYGAWLWGLAEHVRITGNRGLLAEFRDTIDLTVRYLIRFWPLPNYDCWEEFGDRIHPSTLACIYGGLRAINQYIGDASISQTADLIKESVLQSGVHEGRLVKSFGSTAVDSNLLWVSTPFRLLEPGHPIMRKTVSEIEEVLLTGGLHRYREDTYYGGGEWTLLTAFLGWYYCEIGRLDEARRLYNWIEAQAGADGLLPEQVPENLNDPSYYPIWVQRWGEIAKPLLWSHAMYLVLAEEIGAAQARAESILDSKVCAAANAR